MRTRQSSRPSAILTCAARRWRESLVWLALAAFGLQPVIALADTITVNPHGGAHAPIMVRTGNALPLIQISAPSAGGVSDNTFTNVNVPKTVTGSTLRANRNMNVIGADVLITGAAGTDHNVQTSSSSFTGLSLGGSSPFLDAGQSALQNGAYATRVEDPRLAAFWAWRQAGARCRPCTI